MQHLPEIHWNFLFKILFLSPSRKSELLTERLKDLDQTITPNTAPKKKKRSPTEKKQDISIQVSIDDILDAFIESCARFRSKCRDIIAWVDFCILPNDEFKVLKS